MQPLTDMPPISKYAVGYFMQYRTLVRRLWPRTLRDPKVFLISASQSLILGFIVGSIFYQLGYNQDAVLSRAGVLFFIITSGSFNLANAASTFVVERILVNRDRAAGCYAAGPYFLAKLTIDVPQQIIQPILLGVIMYWMAGMNPAVERFFIFVAIAILNSVVAGACFRCIGGLVTSELLAQVLAPVLTVLFFLFAGFFINVASIPNWWIWIYYISWMRYANEAFLVNEFAGSVFNCASNSTQGLPHDWCPNFGLLFSRRCKCVFMDPCSMYAVCHFLHYWLYIYSVL